MTGQTWKLHGHMWKEIREPKRKARSVVNLEQRGLVELKLQCERDLLDAFAKGYSANSEKVTTLQSKIDKIEARLQETVEPSAEAR